MAKGNVLKEKGDKNVKSTFKSRRKKKDAKVSTQKKEQKENKFFARLNQRKTKSIIGSILLLGAIYIFIACLSYLFSWKTDQNLILHTSFFDFIFSSPEIEVSNWLGKFGAWTAHLLMYKWFGISSFGFSFLCFLLGVRLLLNLHILPLKKTFLTTFVAIIWLSITLGLFTSQVSFMGGVFGYFTVVWLSSTFGFFGTFSLIIISLFIAIVALFNPDFKAIYNSYFAREKSIESDTEEAPNFYSNETNQKMQEVDEDKNDQSEIINAQVIDFTEKEEQSSEETITSSPTRDTIEFSSTEVENDTSSEQTEDEDFSVEIAKGEKEMSDSDVNRKLQEFGEYDPKLELSKYELPSIELLQKFESNHNGVSTNELEKNKNKIVETLSNYKIEISKIKATIGPTVTLYEIIPAPGVRISKIKNLEDDIALSLAALGIRIIAPIPGKGTIGIEVPNSKPEIVSMRSLIASEKYQNSKFELPIVLGKTITNETYTFDLVKMPHLLVAGATGQGKSVGLNAILVSLLYKKHPAQVKFVLVDPKKVELTLYNKIERHFLAKLPGSEEAIITDTSKVVNTLNSLCIEMDERYDLLKAAQTRNIKEYNQKFISRKLNPEKGHRYMPYIVVLIDEFADLIMTAGKEVEHPIARLAQLARAIGIHLIVATQRPSVNVITGMIKANFPARIAFRVLSKVDSRTILDASGADQLIGKGDMLISTGSDIVRLQCGFVDTPEVEEICDYIGSQRGYADAFILPEYEGDNDNENSFDPNEKLDKNFIEAARIVVIHQQGSTSLIQRKLRLGYNRAGRIIDQLEAHGIVGQFKGSKARDVLIPTEDQLNEYLDKNDIK